MDHLITEFSFGNVPHHEAELNMRLFADKVLPTVQRDAAFRVGRVGTTRATDNNAERMFAPA